MASACLHPDRARRRPHLHARPAGSLRTVLGRRIKLNGFEIPSLTTRRSETTVELGSGQSMSHRRLLRNSSSNSTEKAPWLGDLPILGAMFRSNSFRRNETEAGDRGHAYLVKPVSAGQIALRRMVSAVQTTQSASCSISSIGAAAAFRARDR
jgi:pilus assembly protein CpaC